MLFKFTIELNMNVVECKADVARKNEMIVTLIAVTKEKERESFTRSHDF